MSFFEVDMSSFDFLRLMLALQVDFSDFEVDLSFFEVGLSLFEVALSFFYFI